MEPIRTASTRERIIRHTVFTAMVVGFSVWSFYDGYYGYPQQNLEQAKQALPADQQHLAAVNRKVTQRAVITQHEGVTMPVFKIGEQLRQVEAALGPPSWKGKTGAGYSKAVWFGPGGIYEVPYDATGFIAGVPSWQPAKRTERDLQVQKFMGVGLGALGLYLLFRMARMVTTTAELSHAGLKHRGHPLVPFESMTGWDTTEYREKGRIKLRYQLDGRDSFVVLDDYKLRAFPAIVGEICARKGYENPVRKKSEETDRGNA